MREASQVVNKNPMIINSIDKASCHAGTPKGILTIMAIGDVNGIMDNHTDMELSGLLIMKFCETIKVNINGRVIGSINCCVSVSLSTAEPTVAKMALYKKYPHRK